MTGARLELRGLGKRHGARAALSGLDLDVTPGQAWAVVGPNGAGKSTLLRLIAGLQWPSAGTISWDGRPVVPAADASFRSNVGYAAETPSLRGAWTVAESLDFFAGLRGVEAAPPPPALRLGALLDRPLSTLSRGEIQRADLAVAIAGRPPLLLLDEPHGGLDPILLDSLGELLRELRDAGTAILLTTHVFSAIGDACSHLLLLDDGRPLAAGRLEDLAGAGGTAEAALRRVYRTLSEAHPCA